MRNKLLFHGLFFVLLQAAIVKEANPDPYPDDGSINIYVDVGKEIDNYLTLSKQIEKTQIRLESALERMSEEIKAMAKRISDQAKATEEKCIERVTAEVKAAEERLNQRMSTEIKAIGEHCNETIPKMSNQQTKRISENQLQKSSEVTTPRKRAAERACEEIKKDVQSSGLTDKRGTPYYYFSLYTADEEQKTCFGALIDKRFVVTLSDCLFTQQFVKIKMLFTTETMGIKAIHIHPDYSAETASLHNIGLIELDSDVEYNSNLYPVCLYTSQSTPKKLINRYSEVQIVADRNCGKKNTSTELCVKDFAFGCTSPGEPIYVETTELPKYKVFGIIFTKKQCNRKPYWIGKMFDHLDFIESIVWPNNDY